MEARVLAGQAPADVALKAGVSPPAVAAYEAVFFDVRTRLGATDFVLHTLIGAPAAAWDYARAWRFFGYVGGPVVLEEVLRMRSGSPPATPGEVAAFLFGEAAEALRRHLAALAQAAPGGPAGDALLKVAAAGLARRRDDPRPRTAVEQHILAMVNDIPWACGVDAEAPRGPAARAGRGGRLRGRVAGRGGPAGGRRRAGGGAGGDPAHGPAGRPATARQDHGPPVGEGGPAGPGRRT